LLRRDGHNARFEVAAERVFDLVREFKPDVLFIDLAMPTMDGMQVATELRKAHPVGSLRIVALSGYGSAENRVASRKAGFDAHLQKPATIELLSATMQTLFEPPIR